MIKSSMNCKQNTPFLLQPVGKDYLWGGTRLHTDFHKNIPLSPLAETWECSTHPDGPSIVASGLHKGMSLRDVLVAHPEYYGAHPLPNGELPIIVKLIDAAKDLSVQVHPNDTYAQTHENGAHGKSEMWYVLDAAAGTQLIYGFYRDMEKATLQDALAKGTIEKYLRKVPVQRDDVFFIDAGKVHALGAGALVAEIQENSNITYRLYDYNRLDKDGHGRELHIDKALDVAELKGSSTPRQPMRLLKYRKGYASELLCRCKSFQVERVLIRTTSEDKVMLPAITEHFQVLLCTEGAGMLFFDNEQLSFRKGDCIFIPAYTVQLQLQGKMQLLKIN